MIIDFPFKVNVYFCVSFCTIIHCFISSIIVYFVNCYLVYCRVL
nr:MAG TPA: hypothetical protein [Bacteriophage sp.]